MKQLKPNKRNSKVIVCMFSLFISLFAVQYAFGQVTIGADEAPATGAILQLKEKTGVTDSTHNASKGFALPRVVLSDKMQLFPMFLANPENPTSTTPNAAYSANKAAIDKVHTGLIVYNLTSDDTQDLLPGLNQWNGTEWVALQTKPASAKFDPITCADVTVNGVYTQRTPVTPDNYLSINLNVTKVGAYTIMASTGNGYNFFLTGTAPNTGIMNIHVPSQGIPIAPQLDNLTFSGVAVEAGCVATVQVQPVAAGYTMDCASVVVSGQYKKGTALNATNTIKLNVKILSDGAYRISTTSTNGVSFSASGSFTVAQIGTVQTITLAGTGTLTTNADFPVRINSNTVPAATCNATIPVMLPDMTYAIIGTDGTFGWSSTSRSRALTNGLNFGTTGTVKINSLRQMWSTNDLSTATNNLNNGYTGTAGGVSYTSARPDIVLFSSYGTSGNTTVINNIAAALRDYINKGGYVVYFTPEINNNTANLTPINTIVNTIFGIASGTTTVTQQEAGPTGSTTDNDYQIANLPSDPIINGAFGDLSGRYYGEDNESAGSSIVATLPDGSIQISSAYNPNKSTAPTTSIVWYNAGKHFVFFGDSAGAANSTANDSYPAYYLDTGAARQKAYGNWGGTSTFGSSVIGNAILELNSVAWALKKAVVNGINIH
ncbi:MAG: hypothetical protein LBR81_06790 [Prevotellaceae bacterium]|jgi:hypothetical protein|nr:hypothetical protein [Prevotellaceae bacterium]